MKISIDLENTYDSEFSETTLAELIRAEINRAVKDEVRATIKRIVSNSMEDFTFRLQNEFSKAAKDNQLPIIELLVKLNEVRNSL